LTNDSGKLVHLQVFPKERGISIECERISAGNRALAFCFR
jgi:hypothetical protein